MEYRELEDLYDKVGGKFKLAVLLQKRTAQLVRGDKRLVKTNIDSPIDVALMELREGKIWLEDETVKTAEDE